ncbi:alpha/beta hydrolase [Siccirubricoccus phaeus]|uniref:alpha/beta hydrolase n=1 Tax=Siccirubricoccus phaeus TaxID=2595053 RepID=UPI0011F19DB3|nr:alpha/beta hydrolase [Siccirubricoccus phaeus]
MRIIRHFRPAGLWLGLLLLLGACGGLPPMEPLPPAEGEIGVERDLRYGEGERQVLDIYRPLGAEGPAPVVMYFHHGAFYIGDKAELSNRTLARALARRGFLVAVPNYRLYPEGRFPAFLEDAAAATAWMRREAAQFGGDPERVVLTGHSAGGYMAVMLTLDGQWLRQAGVPARAVRAGIGLAGPYVDHFTANPFLMQGIFGRVTDQERLMPENFARPGAPPLLLLAGSFDIVGGQYHAWQLGRRVRAAGGEAAWKIYFGLGHIGLLMSLPGLPSLAPVADDMAGFIRRHAGEAQRVALR